MLNKLVALADKLDKKGLCAEAEILDSIIKKATKYFQIPAKPEAIEFEDLPEEDKEKAEEVLEGK